MIDNSTGPGIPGRRNRTALKIALVGAGIAAGAIGATAIGAGAQSTTAGSATSAPVTAATKAPDRPARDHGGSAPIRSDEKSLSASKAATLKAAALKAVPGGAVDRVESDAGDGVYEAHMTKANGSRVTVKFGKNLKVIKVEAGMGSGDPARGWRH